MLEIEIKVRVADLAALRRTLLERGAALVRERHREDNVLYDTRSGTLKSARRALRLRTAGSRTVLTLKGAPLASRRFKIRPEYETVVRDAGSTRKILRALGLSPAFRYAKQRTELRLGRVKICLDELAAGTFVELEGERQHIVKLARQLDFSPRHWIRQDYIEILIEAGYPRGTTHSSSRSGPLSSSGRSSGSASSSPSASGSAPSSS